MPPKPVCDNCSHLNYLIDRLRQENAVLEAESKESLRGHDQMEQIILKLCQENAALRLELHAEKGMSEAATNAFERVKAENEALRQSYETNLAELLKKDEEILSLR